MCIAQLRCAGPLFLERRKSVTNEWIAAAVWRAQQKLTTAFSHHHIIICTCDEKTLVIDQIGYAARADPLLAKQGNQGLQAQVGTQDAGGSADVVINRLRQRYHQLLAVWINRDRRKHTCLGQQCSVIPRAASGIRTFTLCPGQVERRVGRTRRKQTGAAVNRPAPAETKTFHRVFNTVHVTGSTGEIHKTQIW